jgi:multidrug efflux system outer membrane protein
MKSLHFLSCAALLLSGCALAPKYERPAAPVPARYPADSATNSASGAEVPWRAFFVEDRLKRLIELALANNRDLRVAVLNVEQTRAQYRVTRSASLPTVTADGSYSRGGTLGGGEGRSTANTWTASLGTASYELDFFGRVRSLNQQALEKYLATEAAQRSSQITVVSEVATQYFTWRQDEEQLALARQTLDAVTRSYELNKAKFDAGAISELDLRTAEGQVQTARISVETYERQIAQDQNALALLLGCPVPADLPAPAAFAPASLLAAIPAGLPSELLAQRPDILNAEHTLKAANANIGAARAAFFPKITLTANVGTQSSQLEKLFTKGTGYWSFSPDISLPIFTGGQNRANLDVAKIEARIEVANYEKAIQTAFKEVSDALVARASYAREISARTLLVQTEQARYNLADLRYRGGEDTYLNVLSAQQDLYSSQQTALQAQYNLLASQITLYQALGGGWR